MRYFFLIVVLVLFSGCTHKPDLSSINLTISNVNLDKLEFESVSNASELVDLESTSKEVLEFQFQTCLSIGFPKDSGSFESLNKFKNDVYINNLHRELETTVYPKTIQIHDDLVTSFKYLRYYFPQIPVPSSIVYYNSLFHANVFCGKNELGIGIECYLGPKSNSIKKLPSQEFYQWLKNSMLIDYLNRDALSGWIISNLIPEDNNSVVEQMIRWGKILYLIERCLPDSEKRLILRYSSDKFEWAEKNESSIWKYLVSEQLLFSKNERDVSFLINEGPFTIGLPEKSPDRLGQFIGWKMVHDYMEDHENTTLKDLLNTPYNSILQTYNSED